MDSWEICPPFVQLTVVVVVECFNIALFSALVQTHCARSGVLTALPCETATFSARFVTVRRTAPSWCLISLVDSIDISHVLQLRSRKEVGCL